MEQHAAEADEFHALQEKVMLIISVLFECCLLTICCFRQGYANKRLGNEIS